jgi:hypothetical protein
MTIRRPTVLLTIAALGLAAALSLVPSGSSRAGTQPPLSIDPGRTETRSYPALVGAYTQAPSPAPELDPATCANLPSCDVVPLTVVQPEGVSVFDEFVLEIELRWADDTPVADDMSLELWYDPQTANAAASSATDRNPEMVRFAEPTSGKFQIVVANVSGPNTGYTLTVRSIYRKGAAPSELDAPVPTFAGPRRETPTSGVTPPTPTQATSSAPASGGAAVLEPGEIPASLPTSTLSPDGALVPAVAPPAVDPALAGLAARAGTGAVSSAGGALFRQSSSNGPPRPISPPLFVLWTVFVPLAVLGGAALAFLRLRPRALTVRVDGAAAATRPR